MDKKARSRLLEGPDHPPRRGIFLYISNIITVSPQGNKGWDAGTQEPHFNIKTEALKAAPCSVVLLAALAIRRILLRTLSRTERSDLTPKGTDIDFCGPGALGTSVFRIAGAFSSGSAFLPPNSRIQGIIGSFP